MSPVEGLPEFTVKVTYHLDEAGNAQMNVSTDPSVFMLKTDQLRSCAYALVELAELKRPPTFDPTNGS